MRQRHLRIFGRLHIQFERVLDLMLGREVAGQPGGACRRAHAGIRERARESQTVIGQPAHARHAPRGPSFREMLNGPLLVGHEDKEILAVELGSGHASSAAGVSQDRESRRSGSGSTCGSLQDSTTIHGITPFVSRSDSGADRRTTFAISDSAPVQRNLRRFREPSAYQSSSRKTKDG